MYKTVFAKCFSKIHLISKIFSAVNTVLALRTTNITLVLKHVGISRWPR